VYAFQNFARAHKRAVTAQQHAGSLSDPDGVPASSLVRVFVSGVGSAVGAQVALRVLETTEGGRPPLVAVGLMQHECKLSVMHLMLKKAKGYDEPIASKEELIISTGEFRV
jgi:pre-rRNA-processing protein TSR1